MADEFLPPIVTNLKGEIADLVGKLAEAKAAMKAFDEDIQKQNADAGKASGQNLMQEFRKAIDEGGDRDQVVGAFRTIGAQSADEMAKALKARLKSGDLRLEDSDLLPQFRKDITGLFEKAGADGSTALLYQFQKAIGGDMASPAGQAVTDAFVQFGAKGGLQSGQAFSGGFMGAVKMIFSNPATAVVGGVIVAAVVSEVGAMLQGALLAGIGGGVLAGGIIGQLQDPEIKTAVTDLGTFMKGQLQEASSPLHDTILSSITDLQRQTAPIFDTLKQNFIDLQPYLRPLIDSIGVFFKAATPGWDAAVKAAGPALLEVARDAQMMGASFSTFFEQISHNKGAVEGLDLLFRLLAGTISATGAMLHILSSGFNALVLGSDKLEHFLERTPTLFAVLLKAFGTREYIDGIAHSYDGFALAGENAYRATANLTKGLDAQKTALEQLRTEYDAWFTGSMQVDQAQVTLHQDLTGLTDSIKQNGRQWDLNTAAGQANHTALLQAIQGAKDLYDAEVKQYGDSPKFRQDYQATIDKLLAQATAAHDDATDINNLRVQFGGLKDALDSINGKVVHYSIVGPGPGQIPPSQFFQGLFAGGLVQNGLVHAAEGLLPPRSPGTLVLAGEPQTGGEVMIPQRGISQARAAALGMVAMAPYGLGVGPAGGGGGGVVENHTHVYLGGREIAHTVDMIYPALMAAAGQRRKAFGTSGLSVPFNTAYPTGNTF